MPEWTPEATEFLDGYLKQVRALARGAGEDGEEIAAGLREHVEAGMSEETEALVTLDRLTAALAHVGTPQEIVAAGRDASIARAPAPKVIVPPVIVRGVPQKSFAVSAMKAFGVLVLMALSAAAAAAYYEVTYSDWLSQRRDLQVLRLRGTYGTPEYKESRQLREKYAQQGDITRVTGLLRRIAEAEQRFLTEGRYDADGDGTMDFGAIGQLCSAGLLTETSGDEIEKLCRPYVLNLSLRNSSEPNGPSFTCMAVVIPEDPLRPPIQLDEAGNVTEVRPMTKTVPLHAPVAERR